MLQIMTEIANASYVTTYITGQKFNNRNGILNNFDMFKFFLAGKVNEPFMALPLDTSKRDFERPSVGDIAASAGIFSNTFLIPINGSKN